MRRHAVIELAVLLSILVLAAATPPRTEEGAPNAPFSAFLQRRAGGTLCLFRRLTGIDCPGCGLTRSFVQLAHGEIGEGARLNPLGPACFALLLLAIADRVARVVLGRELWTPSRWPRTWSALQASLAVGFGLLGVWRVVAAVI